MRPWSPAFKLVTLVMAVVMLLVSIPAGMARAGLVTTDQVLGEPEAKAQRARVREFVQRQDVRDHLTRLGVNPAEATARVEALSDGEVRQIAGHLDVLPAGQNPIGIIVGAIVLVFIILLITDLLGLTDIFPFVKKSKR